MGKVIKHEYKYMIYIYISFKCEFDAVNLGVDTTYWDDTHTHRDREATVHVSSLHSSMADPALIKSP